MHSPSATTHLPGATTPPTTTPPALAAFELRCREAEWLDRPETLVEFDQVAPTTTAQRYAGLSELLVADAIARSHLGIRSLAGDRLVLTCEMPRYGIPLGVHDLDRPPVNDWRLRDQVNADLLDTDRHGRVGRSMAMQVRRGLIAVAGALPLLMTPMLAHAGGPSVGLHQPSLEQLASFAPPKLPETTQPAPPVEQPTTTAPPVVEPSPTPTIIPPPPPRVPAESLSLTGNTLWAGLLGKQIRLEMKNGQAVAGIVVAQTTTDLAVARAPDGTVVAVPKNEVVGVRMRLEGVEAGGSNIPIGDRPRQDGRGLKAGGVVMISAGAIAALSGTVFLAISPSAVYISLPLLLPGLAMIGGGVAMLSSAGKKRKAFNKAWGIPEHARVNVLPTVNGGRNGGSAGLILQF